MQLTKELNKLNEMLIKMAEVVQTNILTSFEIYKNHLDGVTIDDDVVDQYERLIEERCLDILIKERPYAKDLREVSGILKLVADLERIGDHAEDIMEFNLKLKDINAKPNENIVIMLNITMQMVMESIKSFIKQDLIMANKVINDDDIIDKIYGEVIENIIKENNKNSNALSFAIYTTLVVKYIERIADHAVNIAEWVIYIINGYHKDRQIY